MKTEVKMMLKHTETAFETDIDDSCSVYSLCRWTFAQGDKKKGRKLLKKLRSPIYY